MKNIILKIINHTISRPIRVKHCSQTIYQTLIGSLRLWEATKDIKWKQRAENICDILIKIQRPDGGFDIGYEFDFGRIHNKGESTSPELVALLALVKYYKSFPDDKIANAANRAALWIKINAFQKENGFWAIPYGPYSTKEVMVYNGTSFAAGALGVYLSEFPDNELEIIYQGMNQYLLNVMSVNPGKPGKFWYYNEQERNNLTEIQKNKIDYYHQMQQVEVHVEAEFINPNKSQQKIIAEATSHVGSLQDEDGKIPYFNTSSNIHLWGFCSCASGFLNASKIVKDKEIEYRNKASIIYKWMKLNSWNGSYFFPILSHENKVIDKRFYVRSDAWLFNSFALAVMENINKDEYLEICEKSYCTMEKANFSGIENHASNKRKRMINKMLSKIISVTRKGQ